MAALVLLLLGCTAADPVQQRIKLNTGQLMPMINCGGTSPSVKSGNHFSNYTEFLRQGGRGLDTALTYTDDINAQISAAIKAYPIPRSEIFVTTKVPCCPGPHWMKWCGMAEYNGTIDQDMKKNNQLLGLPITDLTLLHHPCDTDAHTIERYLELEAGLAAGLTKAIGVSNFNADLLAKLAADPRTKITPAVNQCNHAIGNHNESHSPGGGGDDKTVAYCKQHNISYSAFSPMEGLSGQDIFKNPMVVGIAKMHNVSGAQIALKWLVQQGISAVTAVHNPAYVAEDIDLWSWGDLTAAEMTKLAGI
jgi:diketogulonate reductase-like aldo/keto reductase